jgi:DUF4097 and DUF4098 domain-containing protein YvlB
VEARVVKRSRAVTEEEAQAGLKNIEVTMTQEKETVRITARRLRERWVDLERVAALVRVPAGAVLDLGTGNGPVNLTGGTGGVKVRTSNGPIQVKDSKGTLRLTTTNGPIVVTGAKGVAELKTSNGRIDLQAEQAVVTAHSSNGAISFGGSLAGGAHSFSSNNGRITLTLPADARFRVDAATGNGTVRNEFPAKVTAGTRRRLQATVGERPAATVKLQTGNGSIDIRKKQ